MCTGSGSSEKASSLLGEYYLEIDPGTETSATGDGAERANAAVPAGSELALAVDEPSAESLRRRIDETLPDTRDTAGAE